MSARSVRDGHWRSISKSMTIPQQLDVAFKLVKAHCVGALVQDETPGRRKTAANTNTQEVSKIGTVHQLAFTRTSRRTISAPSCALSVTMTASNTREPHIRSVQRFDSNPTKLSQGAPHRRPRAQRATPGQRRPAATARPPPERPRRRALPRTAAAPRARRCGARCGIGCTSTAAAAA